MTPCVLSDWFLQPALAAVASLLTMLTVKLQYDQNNTQTEAL